MSELIPGFGKYAATVWICYGASVAILLAFTIQILAKNRKYK